MNTNASRDKNKNHHKKGITLLELFTVVGIISLVLTMAVPNYKSFYSRMEIRSGLRTVTMALNTARYKAIQLNKRVKFTMEGDRIVLKEMINRRWVELRHFGLEEKVSFSINSSPVFSPTGSVSPLCSIYVANRDYRYKITISMAGRIKVAEI
jgi:type IV fimbrial biogenesis protein FimT